MQNGSRKNLTPLFFFMSAILTFGLSVLFMNGTVLPFSKSIVEFDGYEDTRHVPQGEACTISLRLSPRTTSVPDRIFYRQGNGKERSAVIAEDGHSYVISIDPIQHEETLALRAGSASCTIKLIPRPGPALEKASATIHYPEYMEKPPAVVSLEGNRLVVPSCSTIQIKITSSHNLAAVSAALDEKLHPASILGKEALISSFQIQETPLDLLINWRDTNGYSNKKPLNFIIEPRPDSPSVPGITPKDNIKIIMEDDIMELLVEAHDDHSIHELGVELTYQKKSSTSRNNRHLATDRKILFKKSATDEADTSPSRQIPFLFSPGKEQIPPGEIVINAFSRDNFPTNSESKSTPIVLRIVSPTEHAQTIRVLIDRLAAELRSLQSKTKEYEESADIISLQTSGSLGSETCRKKIEDLADSSVNQIRQCETLSRFAYSLFRESAKNDEIDPDGMKKILQATILLSHYIPATLGNARSKLSNSANEEETDKKRNNLFAAKSLLGRSGILVEEAIGNFQHGADAISSGNFLIRLRKAEKNQRNLTSLIKAEYKRNQQKASDHTQSPAPDFFEKIAAIQQAILNDFSWIEDDLNLFKRNNRPDDSTVPQPEPSNIELKETILKNIDLIRREQLKEAITLSENATDFLKTFSSSIDVKRQSAAQSLPAIPENTTDGTISDSTFELALKLVKINQKQHKILIRTEEKIRELMEKIHPPPQKGERSPLPLSEEQDELQADMLELMAGQSSEDTIDTLNQCRKAMEESTESLEGNNISKESIIKQRNILHLLRIAVERSIQPLPDRPEKGLSGMVNSIMQLPGAKVAQTTDEISIPDLIHVNRANRSAPPSNCLPEDLPQEFRKAFEQYREAIRQ